MSMTKNSLIPETSDLEIFLWDQFVGVDIESWKSNSDLIFAHDET